MTITRMDNVGIVVESLDTAIAFFTDLGLALEGPTTIEGEWAGRVTGDTLTRLRRHGAKLVDEVVHYEDTYRLCYARGPEGILIGLAEEVR